MPSLSDLDFKNLYVRTDERAQSRYTPVQRPTGKPLPGNMPVPEDFEEEIDLLIGNLTKQQNRDFSIEVEDMRLRGCRREMYGNETWVALRRIPLIPPDLDQLGFKPEVLQQFRSWGGRKGGLIVIGGATGAGKTTTAVALLMDYIKTRGRLAYTIEDPVEYLLQGEIGAGGYCYQVEVHDDEDWGEAVKNALRFEPRYIFLGEVRTPAAARHLLRASVSGHLTMCTIHGGSIEEALASLIQTAEIELGSTAAPLLADGLLAVVHQTLVKGAPVVTMLSVDSGNGGAAGTGTSTEGVRSAIRSNKLQTLGSYIFQQDAQRQQNMPPAAPTPPVRPAAAGGQSPQRPAPSAARDAPPVEKKGFWGKG